MNLAPLKEKVEARVAELNARYTKRREALEIASTNGGSQLPANISGSGWHAPCDGWISPETDEVYGKGQWVPMPRDDWFYSGLNEPYPIKKHRVKIHPDDKDQLKAVLMGRVDITYGQSWGKGDYQRCYAYLSGYEPIIKVVEEYLNEIAAAELAADKATRGEAPNGKQLINGVVLFEKQVANYYDVVMKIMVKLDNGATVFGTRPASLSNLPGGIVNRRVEFNAFFEQAPNDKTHAFFKRPTGGKLAAATED